MAEKNYILESVFDIVSFDGFYNTIWSPDNDIYEYELENDQEEDKDFTFDYQGYQNYICDYYTKIWEGFMQERISNDIKLEFVEVASPRYYNYDNDACRVRVKLTQEAEDAIIAKFQEHREVITEWIKRDHASCDGYISFLSNDASDWDCSRLFDDSDFHQSSYLAYMLQYIVLASWEAEGCHGSWRLEEYIQDIIMGNTCTDNYISDIENGKAA